MPLFVKIPTTVEAEQYLGEYIRGVCYCDAYTVPSDLHEQPHVHTMHKGQSVGIVPGDWILPESDGEHYYPVKDDVFQRSYMPAEYVPEELKTLLKAIERAINRRRTDRTLRTSSSPST